MSIIVRWFEDLKGVEVYIELTPYFLLQKFYIYLKARALNGELLLPVKQDESGLASKPVSRY